MPSVPSVPLPAAGAPHHLSNTLASHHSAVPQSVPMPQSAGALPSSTQGAKSGGKGGLIALLLLLFIAAGVAGAYFAGLIPPNVIPR